MKVCVCVLVPQEGGGAFHAGVRRRVRRVRGGRRPGRGGHRAYRGRLPSLFGLLSPGHERLGGAGESCQGGAEGGG